MSGRSDGFTIVTAIALCWLATGAPFSWAIMLFKPATSQTYPSSVFEARPFWSWMILGAMTWLILVWRLRHKHALPKRPIV